MAFHSSLYNSAACSKCEDDVAAWWDHEDKVDANACVPQNPSGLLLQTHRAGQ